MTTTQIQSETGITAIGIINETLMSVYNGRSIDSIRSEKLFEHLFNGNLSEIELAGMLMAMRLRGETPDEISGAVRSMRKFCRSLDLGTDMVFDTCGTGGDNSGSFNISTSVAIILSAIGVPVAKHGNRSVSGKSGSTDFLEALGIPVNLKDDEAVDYYRQNNFIYMAAPEYHPAMKFAVPVRKKLGVRTIFNYLGPFTNPAGAKRQAIGFFSHELLEKYAATALQLNYDRVLLYSSYDGMDEVSPYDKTLVYEIQNNTTRTFIIDPQEYISKDEAMLIQSHLNPDENAVLFIDTLSCGMETPLGKLLALNSALAMYAYDEKSSIRENFLSINKEIISGSVKCKLDSLITG